MSEGKHPGGRPPNLLVRRYMRQYGVTERQVRLLGVAQLARMAPHARATMFASLGWGRQPEARSLATHTRRGRKPQTLSDPELERMLREERECPEQGDVERMLRLAGKGRGGAERAA